jgi:hemerythrin-like metal-binding protein
MSSFTLFWHPSYASDFPHLDDEHRVLFSQINRLGEAVEANELEEFEILLECLSSHLRAHFRREEKLMVITHCAALQRNLNEHREMERQLERWSDTIELCGLSPKLAREVFTKLRDWMPRHILEVDVQVRSASWAGTAVAAH